MHLRAREIPNGQGLLRERRSASYASTVQLDAVAEELYEEVGSIAMTLIAGTRSAFAALMTRLTRATKPFRDGYAGQTERRRSRTYPAWGYQT